MRQFIFSKVTFLILFWTTLLLGLPMLWQPKPAMLGQNFENINETILKAYPSVALGEVSFIILFALAMVSFFFIVGHVAAQRISKSQKILRLILLHLPLASFGVFSIGMIYQYPALFEANLHPELSRFVFKSSFILSPLVFLSIAWLLLGSALLLGLIHMLKEYSDMLKTKTFRLSFFAAVSVVAIISLKGLWQGEKNQDDTKVLLIGIDSLRYDSSNQYDIMPHLNTLRSDPDTVSFHSHYVGVPRTFPSWVEMLSGKHAAETGIRHMFPTFVSREKPLPTLIHDANKSGYTTKVISDFAGDIFPRYEFGFQSIDTPDMKISQLIRMNINQLFPFVLPAMVYGPGLELFPALKGNPAFADPFYLSDKSIDFLESTSHPFLTLFYSTAHFPYAAPYPYYKKFADKEYSGTYLFQKNPSLVKTSKMPAEEIKQIRNLYNGSLNSIDASLGKIFSFLKAKGWWDRTLIIITADHGEDLLEENRLHGHGEHLFGENVLKVPLFIKLPKGSYPRVTDIKRTTHSIDLRPTISALLGLNTPVNLSGNDLSSLFFRPTLSLDPKSKAYRYSYSAFSETGIWFSKVDGGFYQKYRFPYPNISNLLKYDVGGSGEVNIDDTFNDLIVTAKHRSLTIDGYKLLYIPKENGIIWKLFDTRNDPNNVQDISAQNPDLFEEMKTELLSKLNKYETQRKLLDAYVVPNF